MAIFSGSFCKSSATGVDTFDGLSKPDATVSFKFKKRILFECRDSFQTGGVVEISVISRSPCGIRFDGLTAGFETIQLCL